MYKIRDGILTHDGHEVFALGESYYPSFHHAKYPVPPEGDRIGEMKNDLRMMKELGFNHVRFAAIGLTRLNNAGEVEIDTPFVDAMIQEAERNDLSVSVRLQGYAVNLRNFRDVLMIDNHGKEQDVRFWYDFIQTTLHHPGLLQDNAHATAALSAHFAQFPNMVACQIYNEPHYPGVDFFDYHPLAIEAYRKWLVEREVLTRSEAAQYMPPRTRKEQPPRMWALWRLFCRDSLSRFLNESAEASRHGAALPTYTCLTSCQSNAGNSYRGVDYFENARGMELVGYTCYFHAEGMDYFAMCAILDLAASAAEAQGKQAWCIELDSRTAIPPRIFNKNTFALLGSGAKGLIYYQWRGDYPSEATPIPNGCGLLNYDGSKTANYENAGRMVSLIRGLSDWLVRAQRVTCGVGIFHSDYACFMADARENDQQKRLERVKNSVITDFHRIYYDLRRMGYGVVVTDEAALLENRWQLHTLFLPDKSLLSPQEQQAVEEFIRRGGRAYELSVPNDGITIKGYQPYGLVRPLYDPLMSIEDICAGMEPPLALSDSHCVMLQLLRGEGYYLIVLVNTACPHRTVSTTIRCRFDVSEAIFYSTAAQPQNVSVENGTIRLEHLEEGGILLCPAG